jgi:DHA2 family multidrug resistance protein-like MFS transporter
VQRTRDLKAPRLPSLVGEALGSVTGDRTALLGLVASCVALAAAGLDPHVLDPGQARMRAALAETPSLEIALAIAALVQAAFLLAGGAIADIWRSRRILLAALLGLVVACAGATLMPSGPGLVASRVLAWACDGLIIPFAVGSVAVLYRGEARATALGILFAVFGAASILAPALLGLFGPGGPEIQAFGLCAAVALAGVWATRRWLPDLPGALPGQRLLIATTALWAFGIVAAADGIAQEEWWLALLGAAFIAAGLGARRVARRPADEGVRARQGGAALAAGIVIGFSQAAPLLALPTFFTVVQRIDGLLANVLLAPFVIALMVAGPASGLLLSRYSPRVLIIAGVWTIAAGDLAFAAVMGPATPYLALVVPFVLVGAGFVVATAIRTAVIFASTPRHLPATAAALNEAAIGVGTRLGTTLIVLVWTGAVGDLTVADSLRLGLAVAGIVGVIGGVGVFLLLGPDDPVRTVWDLRDERAAASGVPGPEPA